ncbi:hypothetical protein [Thalassospira sp. ER-Se-21-Dark]|uniref:hypothetical protein n=1 Tax=Thalassospira sp. ER-Se-21-Dark TaxID=2585190 RepID=UPI001B314885|nr:hypothetical protein [Thalassospira sp. ER-Se-21-Dark]MBP3125892.1 hypothetical protein [Thalassospira sp. ER-Se-21-Dark]
MKKVEQHESNFFRYVKLYLDEIEEIYDLMKSMSGNVTIQADGFEFDDFDEFSQELSRKIVMNKVDISSSDPYMSVTFDKDSVHVYSGRSEDYFHLKMKEIMGSSKPIIRNEIWKFSSVSIFFLGLFLMVFSDVLSEQLFDEHSFESGESRLAFIGFVLMPVSGILLMIRDGLRKVTIIGERRDERTSIVRRNRDNIFVGVISAFVGGGLLLVFQKVFF